MDTETTQSNELIESSTFDLVFTPSGTRTTQQMGDKMNVTTILNHEQNKGLILLTGIMGTLAISASVEEISNSSNHEHIEIELLDQKKSIQGFDCKKARIVSESGTIVSCWYTEDIDFNKTGIENMFTEIKGAPLEYEVESEGNSVFYKAIRVEKTIDSNPTFVSPQAPAGYQSLTLQQFEKGEY